MSSRLAHRFVLFRDRDILHAAGVATAACVLSAGLVYVGLRIPASLTADHAEVLKAVELHLDGMREEVRRLTVFHVLQNLSLFTASFKE